MKKTKLIVLLISLSLLCACSSNEPKIVSSTDPNKDIVELHFLTTADTPSSFSIMDTLIKAFEKDHSDIKVLFEAYAANGNSKSLADLIDQRMKTDKANDIVTMDVANIFNYAHEDKLLDLTNSAVGKSLNQYARQDSLVDGKIMSVPISMTSYGIWINMDILKSCHLDVPQNWEEFLNCCKVLKENGYPPLIGTKNFPKMFILATLGDIYLSENTDQIIQQLNSGELKISAYAKTGLEHLATLINEGYLDANEALNHVPKDNIELFSQQKGAFAIATSDSFNPDQLDFDTMVIGVPGSNGMISLLASDRRIVVMKETDHEEECLEFLSYFNHKTVQKEVTSIFGSISAYTNETSTKTTDPRLQPVYNNLANKQVMLIQDYNLNLEQWRNLNDIANALLTGESVESQLLALDQLQEEANSNKIE